MTIKQLNLWGGEDAIKEEKKDTKTRKYRTMQEMYGYTPGKTCGTCRSLYQRIIHVKTFYKCRRWSMSMNAATDISLKDPACLCYEERT